MNEESWFTYIIATDAGQLYTGITTDMSRRWQQHVSGKGARYFRGRNPCCLCYLESHENRSLASKREAFIKSLSRKQKLELIHQYYTQTLLLLSSQEFPIQELPLYDPQTPLV
jgi:putative endonuclease